MSRSQSFGVALAGFVALAISACNSRSSLTVSASANPAAVAADAGVQPDAGSAGIDLCGQLLVDRVRLAVRRIDLERALATPDAGADAGVVAAGDAGMPSCECDDDEDVCVKGGGDVHLGPFLVDLEGGRLANGIHQVFDAQVPAGTYEDVRFVINTLSRRQAAGDAGLSGMKDLHASIVVDGSFGGSPFQFTTPMRVQQKQEGPFTVGDGTQNITLAVDPRSWFVGDTGRVLDPRDPQNRGRILANIRCSIRMFSGDRDHRREFDDDDGIARCHEDDDDGGEHGAAMMSGHGGDHRDDGHRGACPPPPALQCGP